MIKDIHEVKKCPECYAEQDDLIYKDQDDQVVCKKCGNIFEPLTPKEEEVYEKSHHINSD